MILISTEDVYLYIFNAELNNLVTFNGKISHFTDRKRECILRNQFPRNVDVDQNI